MLIISCNSQTVLSTFKNYNNILTSTNKSLFCTRAAFFLASFQPSCCPKLAQLRSSFVPHLTNRGNQQAALKQRKSSSDKVSNFRLFKRFKSPRRWFLFYNLILQFTTFFFFFFNSSHQSLVHFNSRHISAATRGLDLSK